VRVSIDNDARKRQRLKSDEDMRLSVTM